MINLKKKSGQALVEFVLILPIFLIMIFTIVDISRVISLKNSLESLSNDAISYYENDKTKDEIKNLINNGDTKDINVDINLNGDYVTISLNKKISPITPGLSYFTSEFFNVKTKRTFIKDDLSVVEDETTTSNTLDEEIEDEEIIE